MSTLPTFEEIRSAAYRELGNVLDGLRSDYQVWPPECRPTQDQIDAQQRARDLVREAREALNEAAL